MVSLAQCVFVDGNTCIDTGFAFARRRNAARLRGGCWDWAGSLASRGLCDMALLPGTTSEQGYRKGACREIIADFSVLRVHIIVLIVVSFASLASVVNLANESLA